MNILKNKDLPSKPTARYRPKADKLALIRSIQDAWAARKAEWVEKYEASINSAATELLEHLYPVGDMTVLQKYGQAQAVKTIGIRIHNYRNDRWDTVYGAELKHPVLVTSYAELSALRPQWWHDPLLGVSPKIKKDMSADEWDKIVASNEKAKTYQMPTELDSVFTDWLDMLHEYRQDLKVGDWIDEEKLTKGIYPTWGEIVTHCPVLLRIKEVKDWAIAPH